MLTQILVDMRDQLVKAKQQVASAIADEKRLRDQADAEYKQAQDWERRAMLAIQEGRDDLAKQALVRQTEHGMHGEQLEATWEQHRVETEKLKNSLRDLNDKIEEAKRKKNLLIARQRRAQAQQRIAETMSSLSEKSAFEAFARMEERIENNERQIKASSEIDEEFTGDTLQRDFKQLEKGAGRRVGRRCSCSRSSRRWGCCPLGAPAQNKALGAGQRDEETVARRDRGPDGRARDGERRGRRSGRFKFAPILTATVFTVLLLWIAGQVRTSSAALPRHPDLAVPRRARRGAAAAAAHSRAVCVARRGGRRQRWAASRCFSGCSCRRSSRRRRSSCACFPNYIVGWEAAIDRLVARVPALKRVYKPGQHKLILAVYQQVAGQFGSVVPKVSAWWRWRSASSRSA